MYSTPSSVSLASRTVRICLGLPLIMQIRLSGEPLRRVRSNAGAPGTAFVSLAFSNAVLTKSRNESNSVRR